MQVINLEQKFGLFNDHWSPKIVASLNGQTVKLAKIQGEFVWHNHEHEDEMFLILKGELVIEFRDRVETLKEGEMIVIPKGVDHRPVAKEEVQLMLIEPIGVKHTGDVKSEKTVEEFEWI